MSVGQVPDRASPTTATIVRLYDALISRWRLVVAGLAVVQVLLTALFFHSVDRNGWLVYQGGDQIWLYTTGWLLQTGTLPTALVSYGWPLVMAPFSLIGGPAYVSTLPATIAFDVLVLAPIALVAVFDIGQRIGGRAFGLWCAFLWVVAPFASIPLFVDRYQEKWGDQFLPQAFGLTQLADYPSMVAVVVAAALMLRSLESPRLSQGLLAGLVAGWALALKPANALFLIGAVVAYLLARRWRQGVAFIIALSPALVTLALWKHRGLGQLPLFSLGETREAMGTGPVAVQVSIDRYTHIDWGVWKLNMSNLREFFPGARLVQWAPFAGAVAVARRSRPAAGLLLAWTLTFAIVKGSSPVASIESGSFWRLVMPAWPAYLVLLAAIPLLVPTLDRRLADRLAPPRSTPVRIPLVVLAAFLLGAVPLVAVAALSPQHGPEKAIVVNGILTPVDAKYVGVRAVRAGKSVRVSWDDRGRFRPVFYEVFRTLHPGADVTCVRSGSDRCTLESTVIKTTRANAYVDGSPEPGVTYRIAVAANSRDDPTAGDIFVISPPVKAP